MTSSPPKRRFVALVAGLVAGLALFAAPAGAATVGALHSGTAAGPENYLYAAGNQVFVPAPTSLTANDAYRFEVIAPDGSVKHTLTTCFAGNAAVGDSYTVGPLDPASGASGYRWVLETFNAGNRPTSLATCNSAAPGAGTVVASKYFDVVRASIDGGLTLLSPSQIGQVRFSGAVNRNSDTGAASAVTTSGTAPQWNVKWLNGVAIACSNTAGADRPDSSATGALPSTSPAYLQFPPAAGASGIFNDAAGYDGLCSTGTGSYSAELRLQPAAGTSTQFVQLPLFNIDATAPALTLTTPPDTHSTTPSFSGSAGTQASSSSAFADLAPITIRIYDGISTAGSPVRTFTKNASAGSWSLSSSDWSGQSQDPLDPGTYTVQVEQSDSGGNVARSSAAFKVDTTPPPVTLTSPAGASELNDTTPGLSGAAGNGGALSNATADLPTVTVRIYSGNSTGGAPARTIPVQKTGNQWTVADQQWTDNSQAPLAAGTYTAQAEQLDGAGNQGLSSPVTFKVDPVAPTVAITTPANGLNTTGTTPPITGTSGTEGGDDSHSADLLTVTVNVYSGPTATGSPQRTFTVNGGGGSWSVGGADWASQGALTQGQWTIQAQQSDDAGNVGVGATRTIRVDQQAPFSGTSVTGATNSASITVSYTDTDLGSSQSGVSQVALYAKGPGDTAFAQVATAPDPGASGTFSYTATKGQGRYFFATVATDNAGNSESLPSDAGVGKAFTHYDTTAPVVTLDSWPALGNDTTPAISGTAGSNSGTGEPAADSGTVTVDIWSGTDTNQIPARSISATRAGGSWALDDSTWTIADSARAPLTEGTWTARARQSDEAGNTGTSATPRTIVVDLHAPQSSDDVPLTWRKDPVQAHLSATDSGGGAVAEIHYTTDGSTPTLASPTYASAITLQNGESAKYFAVDTAGNAETAHTSPAAMVDQVAPTTTDNVPSTFQAGDVTVTLTASDSGGSGADKTYYTTNGTTPTTGSAVYNPASRPVLHNGERIRYFSTDVAGNAETVKTSPVAQVDTTAPTSQSAAPAYSTQQTFNVPYTAGDDGSDLKKVELWAKAPGAPAYSLAATDLTPATAGSIQYTGAGDGLYRFYTVAEDNVGNRETAPASDAGAQVRVTRLDRVAPSTTDNAPAGYVNHDVFVTLTSSDPGGSAGSGVAVTRYTTNGTTPTSGSAQYTVPVALTTDGQQLKYRSFDNAGNAEDVRTATAHIDRTAPSTHASGPAATNSTAFTIGYTATDGGGSNFDHVELYAKGPADSAYTLAGDDTTPSSAESFAYTAGQGDGTYRFYTLGYDHAGNVEAFDSSDVAGVTLDRATPTVAIGALDPVLTDDTPPIGGTSDDDSAAVTVVIYSGSSAAGTPVQTQPATVTGGSWKIDAAHLEDGQYTVQASQTDAAGNTGTSGTRTFDLDAHPPIPAIGAPANGSATNTNAPTLGGTGSTVNGDVPEVTVRVYAGSSAGGTALQTKTTSVGSGGHWAVAPDTLTDGTYTAQADQADTSGNHGLSNATTFQVDTHSPSISSGNQGQAYVQGSTVAADYSCADAAGGSGIDSCSGDVARGASLDTSAPGPHSYHVTSRDRAGNETGATIGYTVSARQVEPGPDDQAPKVSSAGTQRSQALSGGALTVNVLCNEACNTSAGGTISVPGGARVYRLKTVARKAAAGAQVKLKLKLDKTALKAVRKALKKHRKVTAKVKLTATDAAGNRRTSSLTVRITKA